MPNDHCTEYSVSPSAERDVEAIELFTPKQLSLFEPIQSSIEGDGLYAMTGSGWMGKSAGIALPDRPPPA